MELLKSCRSECGMPWLCARQLGSGADNMGAAYNFQAFGQSKKNESLGPKTKVISGIASSSRQ
jgi:hypothetical protein